MAADDSEELPTLESIARRLKSNAKRVRDAQKMHHEASTSTRETHYKGHHIVVRTQYHIEVDGRPLMGHMGVNDEGSVHYHPIPNMRFDSALDMVKKVIDVFPTEFAPDTGRGMADMRHASSARHGMVKKKPAAKKTSKRGK